MVILTCVHYIDCITQFIQRAETVRGRIWPLFRQFVYSITRQEGARRLTFFPILDFLKPNVNELIAEWTSAVGEIKMMGPTAEVQLFYKRRKNIW